LGDSAKILANLADGSHPFAAVLKNAAKPMIIVGQAACNRGDSAAILASVAGLSQHAQIVREGWNGYNILHTAAGRVGALDVGFVPGAGGSATREILTKASAGVIKTVYLLGADEIDQGHHGDAGATVADVILPGAAYTEKDATYVNTEGRVQHARMAVSPPGQAKEDWKIVRALSGALGQLLPFDTHAQLYAALTAAHPHFAAEDAVPAFQAPDFKAAAGLDAGALSQTPFTPAIANFYMTDPISRVSKTMAECVRVQQMGKAHKAA
jgi:NADH-quinone oxidoreductase subunit G